MKFIPFTQVKDYDQVLIVDSYFKGKVMFSHWRGAPRIPGIHDDTSTGIVLNALKSRHPACQFPFVSNNHFDIDGFLGIWALLNPDLALQEETLLKTAALIGDFREWNPYEPVSDKALKICCWINTQEKELFYEPFGEKNEAEACMEKYKYFLAEFTQVFLALESYEVEYQAAYSQVWEGQKQIEKKGSIERVGDIRLQIVRAEAPLPYYALFQNSSEVDIVLSIYDKNRYELEYKYTGWVDTQTRISYPRLSFAPLSESLNKLESSSYTWEYDSIMDTGPMLRLNKSGLSKAQRFADPYEREIYSSSICPNKLVEIITKHYRECLESIIPQESWTWKEMRSFAT